MSDIAAARQALATWVREDEEGRTFLQVHICDVGGAFRLRHCDDADRRSEDLNVTADPFAAREIAGTTASGAHRPLKTAPNLRSGWCIDGQDARGLWTALDYLYPAAALHWYRARNGTLAVTRWNDVADRQSGMYASVGLLEPDALESAVGACCSMPMCMRRVAWEASAATPSRTAQADPETGDAAVPCPEACSLFVSFARSVLAQERLPRREIPGLGRLGDEELAQIRALIRTAADGSENEVREGEFSNPLNRRRLRYLSNRVSEADETAARPEMPCEGCPRPDPCEGCPLVDATRQANAS